MYKIKNKYFFKISLSACACVYCLVDNDKFFKNICLYHQGDFSIVDSVISNQAASRSIVESGCRFAVIHTRDVLSINKHYSKHK